MHNHFNHPGLRHRDRGEPAAEFVGAREFWYVDTDRRTVRGESSVAVGRAEFCSADNEYEYFAVQINGAWLGMRRRLGTADSGSYLLTHCTDYLDTSKPKLELPPLSYTDVRENIASHADHKMSGVVEFYTHPVTVGGSELPRSILRREAIHHDEFFSDLWCLGLEAALMRQVYEPAEAEFHAACEAHDSVKISKLCEAMYHEKFIVDFIGGFPDRGGYSHYGSGLLEKRIGALENDAEQVAVFNTGYLLHVYGMASVTLYRVEQFDEMTLYKVDICEGEGWWGTFFFGLAPHPIHS